MKQYTYWRGEYRTVGYEICQSPHGWTAYIYLRSEQVKLNYGVIDPNRPYYSFDNEPIVQALSDAAHYGVTLYEVITNPGVEGERYKIGWDYQHSWDQYRQYDESIIYRDCVTVIDTLWEASPDLRVYCSTVGGYHNLGDGYMTEHGNFISYAGVEWMRNRGYSIPKRLDDVIGNSDE